MSHTITIPLGFEVGTGKPVDIPIRHMVVAGQTQEAGKTTTMEALISRGRLPAIAFVTKRGEKSFSNARKVAPYFRERADWQFVSSVLEATMRERFKFERSWIISASKGAKTLSDVQRNVRKLMADASGLSESVYLTLDAYLEIVVPKLARVKWAPRLEIARGINTLDLADRDNFPAELQSLVIRSCLEWVYEKCEGTIAIIPEAWEFIPQSRGAPVKLAAVELMRKGAGLHNYVWLDSQDIGGVDKEVLRQCAVWLLGVQREANEITRTLSNIPAGISRPKPGDIATLERGQFFACWGKHVIKTYVWPEWLKRDEARAISCGQLTMDQAIANTMDRNEAEAIAVKVHNPRAFTKKHCKEREDTVTEEQAQELRDENKTLRDRVKDLEKQLREKPKADRATVSNGEAPDAEGLYQLILARLLKDPAIIELRTSKPELRVSETREVIQLDDKSLRGRLAKLVAKGFFDQARTGNSAFNELERLGIGSAKPNVYRECDTLASLGFLTKESGGYQAVPDMKVNLVKA